MTEKIQKINNPLTIIAIFAALAEINATIAISLIDKELHYIFIWFVIGFPTLLVILFFVTLNYNTKVMYSPSDYVDEKNFVESLYGNPSLLGNLNTQTEKISSEIENKLTIKIEESINNISDNTELKTQFETLKKQINSITHETLSSISDEYNISLKFQNILLKLNQWPAFYNLLYVISVTKSNSKSSLIKNLDKYYLPKGWQRNGLNRLYDIEILSKIDEDHFEITEKYANDLEKWVNINLITLKEINDHYLSFKDSFLSKEEKDFFDNKLNQLRKSLKI